MAATDRRLAVFQLDESKANDITYFSGLNEALAKGERAAMLFDLLKHEVDRKAVRIAPMSKAKDRVKRASWSPVAWFVYRTMRQIGAADWDNGVKDQRGSA